MRVYFKDKENRVWAFDENTPYQAYITNNAKKGFVQITKEEADELLTPRPPTPEELKAQFDAAVTARLDTFARQRDWETIDRVLAQHGKFAGDAAIAQVAYDRTWEAALVLFPQVQDGTLSVSDVLARLPELSWDDMSEKTEEPISMEETADPETATPPSV